MQITNINSPKSILGRFFLNILDNRRILLGTIIAISLAFFEVFNYSTTDFALRDLLGDLKFGMIPWATALTIAFCAIDFAGLARLFIPEHDETVQSAFWFLFGAWLLAATMNAALTWWGVSMAIVNHPIQSTVFIEAQTIMGIVPIFVAIMVWVIRILVIGSISVAGSGLLWGESQPVNNRSSQRSRMMDQTNLSQPVSLRPATLQSSNTITRQTTQFEPTYHSMSASSRSHPDGDRQVRR